MEYVYAAMLLHKAGRKVDEGSVKKVLEAAGISPDETRIKALVASLEGVDIDKAIESAQVVSAAVPSSSAPAKEEKKADKEEEKKTEEMAAAGLGALFG